MPPPAAPPVPLPRVVTRGRPGADPACAGCGHLGLLRALRRAGLGVQGAPGCDPAAAGPLEAAPGRWAAAPGRWAAVLGAGPLVADPRAALRRAAAAGARVVVVADRPGGSGDDVEAALAAAGARSVRVDPADLAAAERAARAAAAGGEVLVALAPCPRGAPGGVPYAVAPSRCNRCGACLSLGCAALSDPGDEAMEIDAGACTGCGLCAPLCRGRAIVR